ncbi:MAG TPA: prolyl oligopeptidase family serine peptidase [Pseudonocardiaceae bacterium]|nr:prolyl oligopeptidase family serine peptidase [Pseudonocardiaceae bacterium]
MTGETSFLRLQARTQRFTLGTPREFRLTPDGAAVLFLRSASGTEARNSLWRLDLATGQETQVVDPVALLAEGDEELPPEEKARRERSRTQSAGVVAYTTDRQCRVAVFTLSGKLFVADLATGDIRPVGTAGAVIDPRVDPTGSRIAYVTGGTLRVIEIDGSNDRVLAAPEGGDTDNIAWGVAEFIAAEEMDRNRGYWWSPEGTALLAARTDRSGVRRWHIADPANPDRPANSVAYPASGTRNAEVSLSVLGIDGSVSKVDWNGAELPYLATAHWSAGGPPIIGVQSRDQRTMTVLSIDPQTGATRVEQELTDPQWVDIVPGAPAWTADGALVTVAARDGAYRLLVGGAPVTPDNVQVRAVLDAGEGDVLFTASAEDPTQTHVFSVKGNTLTRVSEVDGVHSAVRSGELTVLVSWGLSRPGPKAAVLRAGQPVAEVTSLAVAPPIAPNVTLLTAGERNLRTALVLPTDHRPGTKLPVLLDPYGGPHAQRVLSAGNAYLTSQWLADQGFAVLIADGRGTPGRGPEWERAVHHELAEVTLTDQIDALHAVARRYPDLDLGRVGIRGWSYGGYLSALAVLRRPDAVHAAVAGAPVTEWRLYDTHYTERYLGHPDDNPEVYDRNSLLPDAPGLRRPLMLIHGLADDNVFAAHTLRLSAALLAAGRDHTVLPLSGVTHMSPTDETAAEAFMLLQLNWLKQALANPAQL